jgi:hypothetical protein
MDLLERQDTAQAVQCFHCKEIMQRAYTAHADMLTAGTHGTCQQAPINDTP